MYKITKVLENFFDDKVSFFLKGTPIPVYRTRQAVSKLGDDDTLTKDDGGRTSACSSVSSAGTSGGYSEESLGRQPSLTINRCTRSLRSRSNINQEQVVSDEGEGSDVDEESLSAGVSSCNESVVVSQRQTRSSHKAQLLSLSSSESMCMDEAGHSMRLRTRAAERQGGRGRRKRGPPDSDNSDREEEEEEEEESEEESDSGEEYVGTRLQRGRGKRGRKGRGKGRAVKGKGRLEGRQLRKRRRVSSYSDEEEEEEEEEEEGDCGMTQYRTITSRSGRVVKPATKFS